MFGVSLKMHEFVVSMMDHQYACTNPQNKKGNIKCRTRVADAEQLFHDKKFSSNVMEIKSAHFIKIYC
jgi:hypothetical protein